MGTLNIPHQHRIWLFTFLFMLTTAKFGDTQISNSTININNNIINIYPPNRRVKVPPLITKEPPQRVYFRKNERIELPCEASGNPTPQYRWMFNDKYFVPAGGDERLFMKPGVGTLVFVAPQDRYEGFYQCFASNIFGTALTPKIVFLEAILEPFQPTQLKQSYPNIGDALQLVCTPPRSRPPARVFWATTSEGMGYTPLNMSDRITQDPWGNLNFANIVPEDSMNGRTYVCIAQNPMMRNTQQGESYQIFPRGQQVTYHPPALMWQTPTRQVAVRGGSISIKCIFSGNPTPRVDWVRYQGVMPARARQESFGQQLTIDNVQYEDEGKYECQGINDEAMVPVRRSFSLIVESDPWWVQKPQSVDAAEGENATIYCETESRPASGYLWMINGVRLGNLPHNRRRISGTNSLTFLNVTLHDSLVIQCNATNKSGYNYTNAYLNVFNEPPFILEPPMVGQKGATGQTVKLSCKIYGSPKPKIVWRKNSTELTGGRFLVLEDGSLQISDLSLVDTGEYTCTGTSRLGYAEATGSLIVKRKRAKNKADKQRQKCTTNKRRRKPVGLLNQHRKSCGKMAKCPRRPIAPWSNNKTGDDICRHLHATT